MTHEINRSFIRPDKSLIDKINQQHVGVAGFEAGPRQVAHPDIKPLDPDWRICGPALTVRPQYWDDRLVSELAPKFAEPGDIIVIDAGGHIDSAAWGMSMTRAAAAAGVAGIVIDGSCMNSALLAREQPLIPIFARGISATTRGAEYPGSINIPVICGGVIVNPGDIILADSDGVVVLPPALAAKIIAGCEAHDRQARSDNEQNVPFYKTKNSEEKLRAFRDITWRD
jgi:4-hydroxy-4-methyl-2-oxoglutarate aldolase